MAADNAVTPAVPPSVSPAVTIVGAGATGCYLAGRMAAAGIPVALLARGASLAAIGARGVRIEGPDGTTTAMPARVFGDGDSPPPTDVAILLVKSYDTLAVRALLPPLIGARGYALTLQNGIENETIVADAVGPARVMSGSLYIGVERTAPGVVAARTGARIVMGRGSADAAAPVAALAAMFTRAGIDCAIEADVLRAKWQKFLFNCGLNPLTAVAATRLGAIMADADGARLFTALVDEAYRAGLAAGAPIDEAVRDAVLAHAARTDIGSSMAEDLAAGRPLEADAFGGTVQRLARRHGLATPATDAVAAVLGLIDRGRQRQSSTT